MIFGGIGLWPVEQGLNIVNRTLVDKLSVLSMRETLETDSAAVFPARLETERHGDDRGEAILRSDVENCVAVRHVKPSLRRPAVQAFLHVRDKHLQSGLDAIVGEPDHPVVEVEVVRVIFLHYGPALRFSYMDWKVDGCGPAGDGASYLAIFLYHGLVG